MHSIILRASPDWNETLISSPNLTDFWLQINEFWQDTLAALTNEIGEEGASLYLNGLHDCLARYEEFSGNVTDPENFCPVIYDSWNCWEASDPGKIQKQPCPNFPHLGFSPSRPSFKTCTEEGEWWRHPETNLTWSNYTQCVNLQDLEFRNTVNMISLSGLGISLFALLLSLFIFFYFKNLECGRIKMHKNLFLSLSLNNFCWIIWYQCVLYWPDVWTNNPVWCRVVHVTKTYFMLSTYFWMLCEGTYLQLLLFNTWGVKRWQIWTLISLGWGLPLLVIIPYTVVRAQDPTEDKNCWMDTGESIWILAVPVVLVISVNILIVINVIRIIKRNRNLRSDDSNVAGGPNSTTSTLKAARAALMLIPILGIHFILLPIRPEQGSTLEYVYEVVSAVSSSYQGFFVSIIFCFLNNDVLDILKKKFCRKNRRFAHADSVMYGKRTTCISVTESPRAHQMSQRPLRHMPSARAQSLTTATAVATSRSVPGGINTSSGSSSSSNRPILSVRGISKHKRRRSCNGDLPSSGRKENEVTTRFQNENAVIKEKEYLLVTNSDVIGGKNCDVKKVKNGRKSRLSDIRRNVEDEIITEL